MNGNWRGEEGTFSVLTPIMRWATDLHLRFYGNHVLIGGRASKERKYRRCHLELKEGEDGESCTFHRFSTWAPKLISVGKLVNPHSRSARHGNGRRREHHTTDAKQQC